MGPTVAGSDAMVLGIIHLGKLHFVGEMLSCKLWGQARVLPVPWM